MGYEFGSGLPKSLDAERIRDLLDFRKSQERNFRAALDRAASPAWMRTDPEWMGNGGEGDFYARLTALLRSVEGRFAWIEAENIFEGDKKKRAARANVFVRLSASIREELDRGAGLPAPAPEGGWGGVIDSVAELLSADRLAELAWALSWPVRDADGLVSAVERHPGIRPGLEEVLTGLVPVDGPDDGDGTPDSDREPGSGAFLVSLALTALDVESVNGDELEALDEAAQRLNEIVSMRRAALERPAALLREWRERQADKAEEFEELASLLAPLERRVTEGRIEDEDMEGVLEFFDKALGVEEEIREKRERLDAAVSEKKYGAVASLGSELEALEKERDELCYEIRGEVYWGLDDPTEDRTEIHPPAPAEDMRQADEKTAGAAAADAVGARDADRQAADAATGAGAQPEPEGPPQAGEARDPAGDGAPAGDAEAESAVTDAPEAEADELPPEPAPVAERAPEDTGADIGAEVAAALGQRRFGLAWHLARAAPDCAPGADAVKLATSVYAGDDGDLSALLDTLDRDAQATPEDAAANAPERIALMASAALTHGLSPTAGQTAAQLLSTLMPRLAAMPSFHALAGSVAEVAVSGVYLPRELLRGDDPASGWREERAALRDETRQWRERERNAKLNFQAATRVWKRVMADWEEDGRRVSIGRMIDMLLKEEDGVDRRRIADIARYWRQHGEDEIRRTDREQRTRASTAPIEGKALNDLLGRMAEAADIAESWLDLIERKPSAEVSFDRKQANLLREAVRNHAEEAIREVSELESPLAPVAGDAIRRYASMFDDAEEPAAEPSTGLSDLLNGDLLANPDIEFDDRGRVAADPVDLSDLEPLLGDGDADFAAAALRRAEKYDFRGAEAAVEFARKTGRLEDANGAQAGIEQCRAEAGRRMKKRIREVSDRLDAVFARGLIARDELESLRSEMPEADSSTDRYRSCMEDLDAISDQIDEREEERLSAPRGGPTGAGTPRATLAGA